MSNHKEPVFRLKPQRTDDETAVCEIKLVGYMDEGDNLGDEMIELETSREEQLIYGKNKHSIGVIDSYDITVHMYRNNVTGNYMFNNIKIPVCSLQFMYKKNIVTGYLFDIFIYFVLDPFKNPHITTAQSYVNARAVGTYLMVLECEQEMYDDKDNLINNKIFEYSKNEIAKEIASKNINISEEEILSMINKDIQEKKDFYNMLLTGIKVKDYKSINRFAYDNFIPLYTNKHINGIVQYGLETRSKKRNNYYGAAKDEYKIPTRTLNINDVKNNPELVDKYLGIESSDEE